MGRKKKKHGYVHRKLRERNCFSFHFPRVLIQDSICETEEVREVELLRPLNSSSPELVAFLGAPSVIDVESKVWAAAIATAVTLNSSYKIADREQIIIQNLQKCSSMLACVLPKL